ncbi:MAG: hypothetical protein LAT75_00540 [Candidatus Cyclonatronum sp.]|uniref:hypothetical protein n=1 Tax=Cyclonatronum sp. TaxID=3024185 RepID=UPI0025C406EC|nr:hypothetical protein [Cyclonatronum sp.]MCC5932964.1 hypothetical protein [Balneolales bacterium]MCH8485319.1 hypothetical protein [Cyclonatronum sp.]
MKSFFIYVFTCFTSLFLLHSKALAHPGHGDTEGHSLMHYLTEPMHAIVLLSVVLMVGLSFGWMMAKRRKKEAARA